MAKTIKINNVNYQSVPSVQIPLADGSGNATFYETSESTIQPQFVLNGYKGFGANGLVTGTASLPSISQDSSSKILTIA